MVPMNHGSETYSTRCRGARYSILPEMFEKHAGTGGHYDPCTVMYARYPKK